MPYNALLHGLELMSYSLLILRLQTVQEYNTVRHDTNIIAHIYQGTYIDNPRDSTEVEDSSVRHEGQSSYMAR